MPAASIETLESALRDANNAASKTHEAKMDALRRLNGSLKADGKGNLLRDIKPDGSAEAKRAYEVATAAYARAARTKNLAIERLAKAGGDAAAVLQGRSTKATRAARPNGSTKPAQVYRPDGEHSFLADLRNGWQDSAARERLERNEVRVTGVSDGSGFYSAPEWFTESWSKLPRPAAVLKANMVELPMPSKGGLGYVPRVDVNSYTVTPLVDGDNVTGDTDLATSTSQSEVAAIVAQLDINRAVGERMQPAAELGLVVDMLAALDAAQDAEFVNGPGGTQRLTGLLNAAGESYAYSSGDLLTAIAKARAQFYSGSALGGRFRLPTHVILHPSIYLALSDQRVSEFPLFDQGGAIQATDPRFSAGQIAGMRVLIDGNLPTNAGGGEDESPIILATLDDLQYCETTARFQFQQVGSSMNMLRYQVANFCQLFADRRPEGVLVVTGVPSSYGY